MKPLLSYYGGKQSIMRHLLKQVNRIPHTVYSEPFAGGAALLFAKPRPVRRSSHYYREAINDNNGVITTFYRVARDQPAELERRLDLTLYAQEEHRLACEIWKAPGDYSDMEIAWAVFVNLNQSFANKANAGWSFGQVSRNHASTWQRKLHRLPAQLDRLRGVFVDNIDALKFIERWDSPQTLHYLDPPYPGSQQGHYSGYTAADWAALCTTLDDATGSYILSNYAQDVEPQSAQERIEIETVMSASKQLRGESRTEILWICDRSHNARPDLDVHLRQTKMEI